MNGKVEGIDWEIKPDQIQTIHPVLALLLILSFKSFLFPFLAKFGIRRPLQKLIFSNAMAVLAFMFTAFLQYKLFVSEKYYNFHTCPQGLRVLFIFSFHKGESTILSSNEGQITVYNSFDCNVYVNSSLTENSTVGPLDSYIFKYTPVSDEEIDNFTLQFDNSCSPYTNYNKLITNVTVSKGEVRH